MEPVPHVTLVIGGARSGKSRWAMMQARAATDRPVYLATSRRMDANHAERIARHVADRGPEWDTIEEQVSIGSIPLEGRVVVVDCLTLWLTNLFFDAGEDAEVALARAVRELACLTARPARWFLVTNELGQGVHAATETARRFVDLHGFTNQHAARLAHSVVQMVAGIPHLIKGTGEWQPE